MKDIYKGNVMGFKVKNFQMDGNNISLLEYETPILHKDLYFYKNYFGVLISFDYDTKLPTFEEAFDYSSEVIRNYKKIPVIPMHFVNENDLVHDRIITNKEFKELKKSYKTKRLIKEVKKTDR